MGRRFEQLLEKGAEMLVTTKGRYALTALADVAQHQSEGMVTVKDVATRQGISEKYLESILKTLVKARLLVGTRGKGGGYKLAKAPADVTVLEVLEAVESDVAVAEGLDGEAEAGTSMQCRLLEMWRELDGEVKGYLAGKTVADVAEGVDPADYYVI